MSYRVTQALFGAGSPAVAQQTGPVGAGIASEPIGDERTEWQKEQEEKQRQQNQGYKKGGSVKGWGIARGARKAKMY